MVKIHRFEPTLTKKNAKIDYKTTKKGLKPLFSWYQTYAFNMAFPIRFELTTYGLGNRCSILLSYEKMLYLRLIDVYILPPQIVIFDSIVAVFVAILI